MKHFKLIASGIDVAPLLAQIEAHPELWNVHKNRMARGANPFTGTDDIWVRYNDVAKANPDLAGFTDEHIPVWYPAWDALPALRTLIFELLALVQGEMLGGVLITRIPDGGQVKPHKDDGWHVEYFEKFYISLQNEPGAQFCCEADGRVEMLTPKPGECWLFDNRKVHWVTNASGKARMTLIVCIRRPPSLSHGQQEPPPSAALQVL